MSSLAVKVERIADVQPHPNADRLEIAKVLDWNCVVPKGEYKTGDLCVYVPIDSVLPPTLEAHIFGPDAKVKLHNGRVRTIKLRGAVSQGLVCSLLDVQSFLYTKTDSIFPGEEGSDLTNLLGVTKYEPPSAPACMQTGKPTKKQSNPNFRRYTEIENAKNYPDIFSPGDLVVVTEKIHGTNFRAGWVPFHASTPWKRIKQFFGLAPKYEFVYGSHNVQLQDNPFGKGSTWLERNRGMNNVYAEAVKKYGLPSLLKPGEVLYGEIYGDGIQKGYAYDCQPGEHKLVVFDLMRDGKYIGFYDLENFCMTNNLRPVPVVWEGYFGQIDPHGAAAGVSLLEPSQKVREGVVIRTQAEQSHPMIGRKLLKYINPEYLLGDQTDFH